MMELSCEIDGIDEPTVIELLAHHATHRMLHPRAHDVWRSVEKRREVSVFGVQTLLAVVFFFFFYYFDLFLGSQSFQSSKKKSKNTTQ
jgi:dolichyl-phosphate-mannose--protein O-mannosyl transferase